MSKTETKINKSKIQIYACNMEKKTVHQEAVLCSLLSCCHTFTNKHAALVQGERGGPAAV